MRDYITAVEEIFSILNAAWDDPLLGARAIPKMVTGMDWGYTPLLLQPGNEFRPTSLEIYGEANYQTATETKLLSESGHRSTGMLGVHIRYHRNDDVEVKIARLLAQVVQKAFRSARSDWISFSNERIVEAGFLKGKYQINIFVTCSFETN